MAIGESKWVGAVVLAVVSVLAPACLTTVCEAGSTYCISTVADGGREQCMDYSGASTPRVCAPVTPVVCAGVECGAGEACCLTTGTCFAKDASSTQCPPAHAPTDAGTAGAPCSSQRDCAADEGCFIEGNDAYCLGVGKCAPRNTCGTCAPEGTPQCQRCGCDGVTYASVQAACVAGIRFTNGPCGVVPSQGVYGVDGGIPRIPCGLSSQCPSGSACCGITGQCYDSSQPWRCQPFADGGVPNCITDVECANPFWLGYCEGAGCGTPGVCRFVPRECGGEVVPVCGCNGVTYTNECWARHAGVRVGSTGACGDAGR